jgi:hypothetical protein
MTEQLPLLRIPRQPRRPEEAVIPMRVIKAYVKDCLKGMEARQAERECRRAAKRQPKPKNSNQAMLFDIHGSVIQSQPTEPEPGTGSQETTIEDR